MNITNSTDRVNESVTVEFRLYALIDLCCFPPRRLDEQWSDSQEVQMLEARLVFDQTQTNTNLYGKCSEALE